MAHGDSGGPNFINGKIAGVNSYLWENGSGQPEANFGEHAFSTRVSAFAGWIDATTADNYDLLLDMNQQLVGGNGTADTIVFDIIGSQLTVRVNGKLYHSDALSRIHSITINGSPDSEKLIIADPMTVQFHGGGGFDLVQIGNGPAKPLDLNYPDGIYVPGNAGSSTGEVGMPASTAAAVNSLDDNQIVKNRGKGRRGQATAVAAQVSPVMLPTPSEIALDRIVQLYDAWMDQEQGASAGISREPAGASPLDLN
jgi:hypothetical protein